MAHREATDPLLWGNLGDAYHWGPGLREKAPEAYRRAVALSRDQLKVNPRDGVVRAELAYYLVMSEQSREARKHLAEALEASPTDTQVLYLASQVHEILGERAEALRLLRETIRGGYPRAEVRAHPLFASLAEDPDFRELVADD